MRDFCDDYGASEAHFGPATQYAGKSHRKHLGRGYRAGYRDVAAGGDGVPPIFPPRRYWHVWNRNPRGHRKVEAWFYGYSVGATVAEQDGVGQWHDVPLLLPATYHQEQVTPETFSPPPEAIDHHEHVTHETFSSPAEALDAQNRQPGIPWQIGQGPAILFEEHAGIGPWDTVQNWPPSVHDAPAVEMPSAPGAVPPGVPAWSPPVGTPIDSNPSGYGWRPTSAYSQ